MSYIFDKKYKTILNIVGIDFLYPYIRQIISKRYMQSQTKNNNTVYLLLK